MEDNRCCENYKYLLQRIYNLEEDQEKNETKIEELSENIEKLIQFLIKYLGDTREIRPLRS